MDTFTTLELESILDLGDAISHPYPCSDNLNTSDSDIPLDEERYDAGTTRAFCKIA